MGGLDEFDFQNKMGNEYSSQTMPGLDEIIDLHGVQFIESAYRRLLLRNPDESGLAYYLGRLQGGAPKVQILGDIASSRDARELAVNLRGLTRAVILNRLSRIPLAGRLFRCFPGVEGTSSYERHLRVVEEMLHAQAGETEPDRQAAVDAPPDQRVLIANSGYFDAQWYREQLPKLPCEVDLIDHFLAKGGFEGRTPSEEFDCRSYLAHYADVRLTGMNPLVHFLLYGKKEGRLRFPTATAGDRTRERATALANHEIHCLLDAEISGETAVFVAHRNDGSLEPHVNHTIAALNRQNIGVILVVIADRPMQTVSAETMSLVRGLFIRQSRGHDIAAWVHVLQLYPMLFSVPILYLANDSLLGPCDDEAFARLIGRIRSSAADVIGLTRSNTYPSHIHSYFHAFKTGALFRIHMHNFFNEMEFIGDRDTVIRRYEAKLAASIRQQGLKTEALFDSEGGFPADGDGYIMRIEAPQFAHSIRPRIALLGPWNYDGGEGYAARQYISALWHTDFLVNLHPIRLPYNAHARVAPAVECRSFSGDADLVILHLDPDAWASVLSEEHWEIISRARKVVGAWVGDAAGIPQRWIPRFDEIDEIWAPTSFCAGRLVEIAKVPVKVMPLCITAALPPANDQRMRSLREEIGIPPDQGVILCCIDGPDHIDRRNSAGLITAFEYSCLGCNGWVLVVKTMNLSDPAAPGRQLQELARQATNVFVIDKLFDAARMDALMDLADIYASPHSFDAAGVAIARAMSMAKPVVATDFGGSRDFLDSTCGYPVPYVLRSWAWAQVHHRQGGVWAEVDIAALAGALRTAAGRIVIGDRSIGEAARERAQRCFSPRAVGESMQHAVAGLLGI